MKTKLTAPDARAYFKEIDRARSLGGMCRA